MRCSEQDKQLRAVASNVTSALHVVCCVAIMCAAEGRAAGRRLGGSQRGLIRKAGALCSTGAEYPVSTACPAQYPNPVGCGAHRMIACCMVGRIRAQAALAERTTMQRMERMKVMISKQRARAASREASKQRLTCVQTSVQTSARVWLRLFGIDLASAGAAVASRFGAFRARAARFMRSLSEH
jgi:hypothetical protein